MKSLATAAALAMLLTAQARDALAIRDLLDAYLIAYEPQLSALVADEEMTQRQPGRMVTNRRIHSEVAFVALPGNAGWLGFRRVVKVNGKAIKNRDELVAMVVATKPGTTVPVRVVRDRQERTLNVTVDELDLETEQTARADDTRPQDPQQETSRGFGMSLGNLTPQIAQRLRIEADTRGAVIMDVEQDGAAAKAGLAPGDVVVRVGRAVVTSAAEAQRELERVASGRPVFLRVIRNGQEQFISVTKE